MLKLFLLCCSLLVFSSSVSITISPRGCCCLGGCPLTWTADQPYFSSTPANYTFDFGPQLGNRCEFISEYAVQCAPRTWAFCDDTNLTLVLYHSGVQVAESWSA